MKKPFLLLLALLLLTICFVVPLHAKNKSFGPIVTYSNKKLTKVSIFFYTEKKEQSGIFISNSVTNYVWKEKGTSKYHSFKIKVGSSGTFYYRIISKTPIINNKGGLIRIPRKQNYTFAIIGDTHMNYKPHLKLSAEMQKYKPCFVINTGDIIRDSLNKSEWAKYFDSRNIVYHTAAFLPVIGNHDFYGTLWRRFFDVSNKRYPYYSYNMPGLKMIVFNTEMYFQKDSVQYQWLVQELRNCPRGQWKVVVFHRPPFSTTHHSTEDPVINARKILVPLMEKYKVHFVINGHDHLYERLQKKNIVYITTGGGAKNMYIAGPASSYRKKVIALIHHFIIVDVSKQKLIVKTYNINNQLLDKVEIKK